MGVALFDFSAIHSAREVSLNAGSYSVLSEGTSFGTAVRSPMFAQVFDNDQPRPAGAPVGAREQQIRVECSSSSVAGLQTLLDALERVCADVTRKGGGWLRHRSTGGSYSTRYRVSFAKVSAPEVMGAWYESSYRAVVTIALAVDAYGLADPYDIAEDFSADSLGTGGAYNIGGADWSVDLGSLAVSGAALVQGDAHASGNAYGSACTALTPTAYWRMNDIASPPVNGYDAAILARADTVAYWELGEASGSTAANSVSGGLYPGTINGNPTLGVAGPLLGSADTAIDFDGTGDRVAMTYAAALNPAAFTVAAWIYRDTDTGGLEHIFDCRNTNTGFQFRIGTGDKLELVLGDGAAVSVVTGATSIPTGRWIHAAASFGGGSGTVVLNGVSDATAADAYSANLSSATNIGGYGSALYFNGKLAKVSLHNAALTAAEIAALACKGWPLTDAMGNHNGGMFNAPTTSTGALTGDTDTAIDFDGSNDYALIPYDAALNAATFSVTGWVRRDADTGAIEFILDSRITTGLEGWAIRVSAADKLAFVLANGTASETLGATSLAAATWYHIACTYDGTTARVYLNGALDGSGADAMTANTSGHLRVGINYAGTQMWNGDLDELAYHGGVVLTADQIAQMYRDGLTESRAHHTGTPHTYGDISVPIKHTVGTQLAGYKSGTILRRIDATNRIEAYVDDTGTASRVRIDKIVAGVRTNLATTTLTRLTVSTSYWLEASITGNVITAEHWTTQPTPMGTDAAQATATLTTAEAAVFGTGITARVGLVHVAYGTGSSIDDFKARPLTYRERTYPRTHRLEGAWSGTTDALAAIHYTASGGTAPVAMLYSWWPRVAAHNYVWNGGGEVVGTSATVAYGWVATAVSGVIGAATTVVRTTTAASVRTGTGAIEIATPATTDTGASFAIYRRGGFRKGQTYTAQAYLRSAADTTVARLKLGISGDLGTGSSVALSTTWTLHTVTWTCAADADVAYVAAGVAAATATTFQVDDLQVFEGTTAPTFTPGGFGPGIIPAAAFNTAAASTRGTEWVQTTDSDYLVGTGPQGSGAITADTGELEFPILPHLFTPDDYTGDEVDIAVFARVEVASTQTSLNAAISIASERGTSYGARRYGNPHRATGKALTLPSSSTVFKAYYLGTVTMRVDRTRPRREWLRIAVSNSGAATGTVGFDYLVVVPARSLASTQYGATAAATPDFIASTAETTKAIGVDTAGEITGRLLGSIVDHTNGDAHTPDDGIGGAPLRIDPDGCELLVWPSDQVIDLADSSAHSMAETYAGTLHVALQPRTNLLRQS